MRVLLIHQAFVSPQEAGGTRHYELAQHLKPQGYDFTIVASNLSYLTGKPVLSKKGLVAEQELDGVRVLRAYTYPSLHRSFVWRVVSFVSFMLTSVWAALRAGPVDLVMGTSPPIFQALSAWVVAVLRRRPFLLEIRDLWPEFAIDMKLLTNPVLIRLSRGLEQFLYARATHLLVNSPAYRDYLLGKGLAPEKISLIPNGVEADRFYPDSKGERIRNELNLDGKSVITYAGALGLANDLATVIQAADRLRDHQEIQFLLVGDGKERANLESMARQLCLSNVTFAGSRPKCEMPEILAASDVCIAILQNIPMFRTTFPNKVFDYMAAGRPTVLAIDGVIRDVVESARAGTFVQPGDAVALAQAVQFYCENPDVARETGWSARAYVMANFDRERQALQLSQLLQQLMGVEVQPHAT